jgi:hypothetical protein
MPNPDRFRSNEDLLEWTEELPNILHGSLAILAIEG